MALYEIWSEGYCTQDTEGARVPAMHRGTFEGETFADACIIWARSSKEIWERFDRQRLAYWGCRLFDNEADARKVFG